MRFRGKSIRRKIVALLLVPLVSLTALWGFSTVITGRQAVQLLDVAYVIEKVGYPIEDVVRVIQKERRQTLVLIGDPRASAATAELTRSRAATDAAVRIITENAKDPEVMDELAPETAQRLRSILEAFRGIEALRRSVDRNSLDTNQALELYSRLIDPGHEFLMNLHALENVEMDKQGRALVGITRARETLSARTPSSPRPWRPRSSAPSTSAASRTSPPTARCSTSSTSPSSRPTTAPSSRTTGTAPRPRPCATPRNGSSPTAPAATRAPSPPPSGTRPPARSSTNSPRWAPRPETATSCGSNPPP